MNTILFPTDLCFEREMIIIMKNLEEIKEFEKYKFKVMNYIMYKKRSEYEIKNKFSKTIEEEMLNQIIDYIKEAGYIDDSKYIKRTVDEFIALKNMSVREIENKLYSKGLNSYLIKDYIYENKEELDEYELESAKKIVIKKSNTLNEDEIKQYLLKKGYRPQIISDAMEEQ